jgi:hypothetical protein
LGLEHGSSSREYPEERGQSPRVMKQPIHTKHEARMSLVSQQKSTVCGHQCAPELEGFAGHRRIGKLVLNATPADGPEAVALGPVGI